MAPERTRSTKQSLAMTELKELREGREQNQEFSLDQSPQPNENKELTRKS